AASTRQEGLVQSTDLAPTILEELEVDAPGAMVGSTIRPSDNTGVADAGPLPGTVVAAADAGQHARLALPLVAPFAAVIVAANLVVAGLVVRLHRRVRGQDASVATAATASGSRRIFRVLSALPLAVALIPASYLLANAVPWWRMPAPQLSYLLIALV